MESECNIFSNEFIFAFTAASRREGGDVTPSLTASLGGSVERVLPGWNEWHLSPVQSAWVGGPCAQGKWPGAGLRGSGFT